MPHEVRVKGRHWCPTDESVKYPDDDGVCENCTGKLVGSLTIYTCPKCERGYLSHVAAASCQCPPEAE